MPASPLGDRSIGKPPTSFEPIDWRNIPTELLRQRRTASAKSVIKWRYDLLLGFRSLQKYHFDFLLLCELQIFAYKVICDFANHYSQCISPQNQHGVYLIYLFAFWNFILLYQKWRNLRTLSFVDLNIGDPCWIMVFAE